MREYKDRLIEYNKTVNNAELRTLFILSFMILIRICNEREKVNLNNKEHFIRWLKMVVQLGSEKIRSKATIKKLILNDGKFTQVTLLDVNGGKIYHFFGYSILKTKRKNILIYF